MSLTNIETHYYPMYYFIKENGVESFVHLQYLLYLTHAWFLVYNNRKSFLPKDSMICGLGGPALKGAWEEFSDKYNKDWDSYKEDILLEGRKIAHLVSMRDEALINNVSEIFGVKDFSELISDIASEGNPWREAMEQWDFDNPYEVLTDSTIYNWHKKVFEKIKD